jgi:hypothetical protein
VYGILTDPEARGDNRTEVNYGHQREPALLLANVLRAFNATGFDGGNSQSDGYLNPQITSSDQDMFRPPSVFSYYPPDFPIPGVVPLTLAPELAIFSPVTTFKRGNSIINTMLRTGVQKNTTNPYGPAPNGTKLDLSALLALGGSTEDMVDYLDGLLLHRTMSADMRAALIDAINAVAPSNPLRRAQYAAYLVLTSSQYQVQR